jgi:hypothetical protein
MTKSGVISTVLSPIYICDIKEGSQIQKMRFTNSAAYNLNVQLFIAESNKNVDLYDLLLDAGDIVTDNMSYELNFGDKLLASSTAGKTFYSLKIV